METGKKSGICRTSIGSFGNLLWFFKCFSASFLFFYSLLSKYFHLEVIIVLALVAFSVCGCMAEYCKSSVVLLK